MRQHAWTKRRTGKKLHLYVNASNSEIISASFTDYSFKDSEIWTDMLEGLGSQVSTVSGNEAYDTWKYWDFCHSPGMKRIFPLRRGAKIKKHGKGKGEKWPRDETIRMIRRIGKKMEKRNGDSRRSIAETAMSRFKILMGDKMASRNFGCQANEAFIKCKLLNMMTGTKIL